MILSSIATWRGPTPNRSAGAMWTTVRGLILHVQEGTQEGSISWCLNPASQVSAHFFAGRDGSLVQLVDTADMAWSCVAGNPYWISVECEGYSGQSLTEPQLETVARLLAALYEEYDATIPLAICDDPINGRGVTGHGLGGAAYGNHLNCPGAPILGQRSEIIYRAAEMLGLTEGSGMQPTDEIAVTAGFAARYPATAPDGFTAGALIPVSVLMMGAAIRAANNEHLIADLSAELTQVRADVEALKESSNPA